MAVRAAAAGAFCGAAGFTVLSLRDGPAVAAARVDAQLRPSLASVLPHSIFVWLYSSSRQTFIYALASTGLPEPCDEQFANPSRALGLVFRNDLGNAAGLDKDATLLEFSYRLGAGYAVVGTVLDEPHTGNVFAMLGGLWHCNAWTPLPGSGGALNSLGLPSRGVDIALRNIEAFRQKHGIDVAGVGERPPAQCFPIGVSIMGHPAQEGQRKLDGVLDCVRKSIPVSDFLEINESCPNVKHGAGGDGLSDRMAAVIAVRDELAKSTGRRVPILVKLGDLGDVEATVALLASLGVDGLIGLNTQRDYEAFDLPAGDRQLLDYYTREHGGGLSGPPIRERSLRQIELAVAAVQRQGLQSRFTVVHAGGVASADDVRRSRAVGAPLRQWYTGLMHGIAGGGEGGVRELYARTTA